MHFGETDINPEPAQEELTPGHFPQHLLGVVLSTVTAGSLRDLSAHAVITKLDPRVPFNPIPTEGLCEKSDALMSSSNSPPATAACHSRKLQQPNPCGAPLPG